MSDAGNVIDDAGRRAAEPGPDHGWFAWSASPDRPPLRWPGDRRSPSVSSWISAQWEGAARHRRRGALGGRGLNPYPDLPRMSHREFGHRVGVFRLLRALEALAITPAVSVDVLTVEHYARLLDHVRRGGRASSPAASAPVARSPAR